MNKQFTRMQKLAGILTEEISRADSTPSHNVALDIVTVGPKVARGRMPEGKGGMSKSEAKKMIKDAILAEVDHTTPAGDEMAEASDTAMDRMQGIVSTSTTRSFVDAASSIIRDLKMDGFDEDDIYDFLMSKVKTLSVDESLGEAKKKKGTKKDKEGSEESEEGVDVQGIEIDSPTGGVDIDMDMNDTPDMEVGSTDAKDTFDDLAKAYQAAKGLGDEKLIQQLANTITYFNKNIILK